MLAGGTITAIVPARGGSKGLPGKNLLPLAGEPLVARAARFGVAHPAVDRVIVSSDDDDILAAGGKVTDVELNKRPANLATDDARSADVVRQVIADCAIDGGWLLLLQPTSPLRAAQDLDAMLDLVADRPGAPGAVSVVAHDEPRPEKLQKIEAGRLVAYLGSSFEGPRQSLPQPYALNGAFYLIRTDVFLDTGSLMPPGTLAGIMPPERSVNIDGPEDWQILNAMLAAGHWVL